MSYRKARTQYDEISLWLTHSTCHNLAEKKKQCISTTQQYPSNIQHSQMHNGDQINSQNGSVRLLTENFATNRAPNPAQCDTPMGSDRITLLWELVTANMTTVWHLRLSWMQVWDISIKTALFLCTINTSLSSVRLTVCIYTLTL